MTRPQGRPKHFEGDTKRISLGLPIDTIQRLDWLAAHRGENRAVTLDSLINALYSREAEAM